MFVCSIPGCSSDCSNTTSGCDEDKTSECQTWRVFCELYIGSCCLTKFHRFLPSRAVPGSVFHLYCQHRSSGILQGEQFFNVILYNIYIDTFTSLMLKSLRMYTGIYSSICQTRSSHYPHFHLSGKAQNSPTSKTMILLKISPCYIIILLLISSP